MKRRYNRMFNPPAAVVRVEIRRPGTGEAVEIDAKLDTGADVCGLPEWAVATLDLLPLRLVRAAGFSGLLEETPIYRMDLELAGRALEDVEVLATRRPYAIIGRNVLRTLVARFDGPLETVELRWPRPRRRRRS
jgi:predicted aspartyl protease